ncbi:MAG: hypothetical protein CIT01_01070 [Methanobacterium sp. BRmetb2]|nr:MAG: hypothetical protein CIT01_01070 [Methanobacterium sp. BRmetb2]
MKISVNKIQIIRPESNPKKSSLNLNVDWHVDFMEKSRSSMEYSCFIKTSPEYPIDFKINGIVGSENLKEENKIESKDLKDLNTILPGIIFDNSLNIMLNLINLTKDVNISINRSNQYLKDSLAKKNSIKSNYTKINPCLNY